MKKKLKKSKFEELDKKQMNVLRGGNKGAETAAAQTPEGCDGATPQPPEGCNGAEQA